MKSSSILDQEKFWEIVEYLVELDHTKDFKAICLDLSITNRQLNSFINFLREVDYQLETAQTENGKDVIPPEKDSTVKVEFSLLEWLEFQAHFPVIGTMEGKPFHKSIKNKLEQLESEHNNHDLFSPLPTLESILDSGKLELIPSRFSNGVIEFIEESIIDKKAIQLESENKNYKVFPRKIVFVDGDLLLIAEGSADGCLISIDIKSIINVHEEDISWKENFSKFEVNDFIKSFRSMDENTVRLVLKIFSRERFNLNLSHHFFENPCMFSNASGDYIWAATIEPNEELYEWLCELGSSIEILDPTSFKVEFLKYCENKLKKLA
jgi:hypothetical protein